METIPTQGSPPGPATLSPPSGRPRRKVVVALVAVAVLLAGFAAWWVWLRPYSIAELEAMMHDCEPGYSLCRFQPGQTILLRGAVHRIQLSNTSLGPVTDVFLDESTLPVVFRGDLRSQFRVGLEATIPLAIRPYRYNGIEYLGADEFPIPAVTRGIAVVIAAVGRVAGLGFLPVGGPPDALALRLATHRGEAFPLGLFRFSVVDVQGPIYVGESGYLGGDIRDEVEGWTPAGNGSSPLGHMSFVDVAGNGRFDIGDRITIRPNGTSSPRDIDSRMLVVNDNTGILLGFSYWYETSEGIPYPEDLSDFGEFAYQVWSPHSFLLGPPENVSRLELTAAGGEALRPADESFVLRNNLGQIRAEGTLAADPFLSADGMTGRFLDLDGDGFVSQGDRLEFRGGSADGYYTLDLHDSCCILAYVAWRPGRGAYTGNHPLVGFSNETRLNATALEVDVRLEGGYPWEEIRNFTLGLFEGDAPVLGLDLRVASRASGGGYTLSFFSGGDPAGLDAGDRVRVEGLRPGLSYSVRVRWTGYGTNRICGTWPVSN